MPKHSNSLQPKCSQNNKVANWVFFTYELLKYIRESKKHDVFLAEDWALNNLKWFYLQITTPNYETILSPEAEYSWNGILNL